MGSPTMEFAENKNGVEQKQKGYSIHPVNQNDEQLLLKTLYQENWSNDKQVDTFESQFAEYLGVPYVLLVVNATAAFKICLMAANIGNGDEVIIPGFTWPSMIAAIVECGAIPVPVDIEPDTFGLDIDCVKQSLTKKTKAIVPTHFFCSQTDMPSILELVKSRNILVIEDAAHTIGTRRFGKCLGTFGDAGIFSFNQKKLLSCGEGGCLVTTNESLYEIAKKYREIDSDYPYPIDKLPGAYKISEFQASVLISQLKRFHSRLKLIEERAEILREMLQRIDNIFPLKRLPSTDIQSFYSFCFRIKNCKNILQFRNFMSREIGVSIGGAYAPLSELKFRSHNNSYSKSLEKSFRKHLPNCMRAHYSEAVRFSHSALLENDISTKKIADIVSMILKQTT